MEIIGNEQQTSEMKFLQNRMLEKDGSLSAYESSEEELRRSQLYHRYIAENTTDFITILTLEAVFTYVSPSHHLLGYEPSELVGKPGLDFVHPDDIEPLDSLLMEYASLGMDELQRLKDQSSAEAISFRIVDKSGKWHHMEATANLVGEVEGESFSILLVSRDVTDRIRVEDALRQAYEQLEKRIVERTSELAKANEDLRDEIIERRRAEEAIRSSEERFRLLFEYAPDACYLNDLEGVLLDSTSAAEEMTGYTREELIGHTFMKMNLLPSSQIPSVARLLARNALGNPTGPDEIILNKKDNTQVIAEIQTYPVRIAEKRLVLGIARDITRRKQVEGELGKYRNHLENLVRDRTKELGEANKRLEKDITERKLVERALQESEEKLRLTVEAVTEGIVVIDLKGRILQVNQAAVQLQDFNTREELTGRDIFQFVSLKDRARAVADFQQVVENERRKDTEYRIITKAGLERDVEVSAGVLKDAGSVAIGVVCSIKDVSERKQAEANLQADKELIENILTTMPNAVLVLRRDLSVILANQTFYECFQLERGAVVDGLLDQLVPEQNVSRAVLAVLEGKECQADLEFRHKVAGTERTMVANVFPMRDRKALLVINDVTEERARQERNLMTERLASVGEMAAGVAHELNNPLTSVVSLAEMLAEEDLPDEIRADIQDIYKETMRAAGVVRKLLAFSRQYSAARLSVQVNEVINDILKLRNYEHKVNNITLETRLDADLPEIAADYHQLQQVFLNIILNAESAMTGAHGRGVLTIASTCLDDMVRISITDDGPGIPEENLNKVFNPFYTTKDIGQGTGLGLSICFGIVKEHGGRIYVERGDGNGATFVVELPVNRQQISGIAGKGAG